MARRIRHNELAAWRGKIAIGDINGDALFALGLQPVHQQGEVEIRALCAMLFRVIGQAGENIIRHHFGLIEHPADQRGFAIIDRAAGDEAQQGFLGCRKERIVHGQHQKYPSCFFCSIEAEPS